MINKEHEEGYYKNALTLAYLGDSVFSLMVREFIVKKYNLKPNSLNKKANQVVCARAQAEIMREIKPTLTEEELDVVNRARNSHTNNKAKNSTLEEYNLATQFEALLGFLYLSNQTQKMEELFNKFVEKRLLDVDKLS